MKRIVTALITAISCAAATNAFANHKASHAGGCVRAGGEATMITEDLAKYMAEAALKNSIAAHNWKASGPVKMKCDAPNGLPHCLATRRACG